MFFVIVCLLVLTGIGIVATLIQGWLDPAHRYEVGGEMLQWHDMLQGQLLIAGGLVALLLLMRYGKRYLEMLWLPEDAPFFLYPVIACAYFIFLPSPFIAYDAWSTGQADPQALVEYGSDLVLWTEVYEVFWTTTLISGLLILSSLLGARYWRMPASCALPTKLPVYFWTMFVFTNTIAAVIAAGDDLSGMQALAGINLSNGVWMVVHTIAALVAIVFATEERKKLWQKYDIGDC